MCFERCDPRARFILLTGYFRLLETLAARGLPTAECASAIAAAG